MRRRREVAGLLASALFFSVILVVSDVHVALACSHNTLQHLFRQEPFNSTADAIRSHIYVRDRGLNPDCTADAESHSTAHVRNSTGDKFAEVGWEEHWHCPSGSCTHNHNIFWEVKIGSTIIGHLHNGPHFACCGWYGFKVENVPGTLRWKFFFDPGANGGWIQVGPSDGQNADFGQGVPQGETARRGGSRTGASDEHSALARKNCDSCTMQDWTNNDFRSDDISGWHGERISDTRYEVVKDP
jgi:hypothetical protein